MRRFLAVLVLAGFSVNAQTITQIFGSGANQFSIEFVEIGNPGNAPDTTRYSNLVGRVDYIYKLGKYEISRDQVNKANTGGSLGITLFDVRSTYMSSPTVTPPTGEVWTDGVNRPATAISWYEAARFVNYLNTSQGKQAAYSFDGSGNVQVWNSGQYNGTNQYRHKDAFYFLPCVDEWYKGAYGSLSGTWYDYPSGNDITPVAVSGGTSGAVYGQSIMQGPADITNAGGLSAYGTMAQGGNVWEWLESPFENFEMRGGSWLDDDGALIASPAFLYPLVNGTEGFRVAMVPEPSSPSLLLVCGAVLMGGRRRK